MARGKKKESTLTPEEKLAQALVPDWEWPYKVPENWCWTTLEKVATVVTGGTPSKNHPEYYEGTFPFYKPSDLDAGRYVYEASEYLSDEGKAVSRIIPQDSTAVCCIGSIGKCGYITREGTTNQQINSAIPHFNPLYLYYFLNTEQFVNELWSKASATTISIVNKSKMEQCYFPLTPLAEQQRIVDRIEYLFAKLDEAKEKAQSVLDSFETRKAAILHKAFTGELTSKWRTERGIGLDTWKTILFDNCVAKMQNGLAKRTGSNGVPFAVLRLANLSDSGFITDDLRQIVLDEKEQENYRLIPNDVLMIRVNGSKDNVGKQLLMGNQKDWAFCDHIIRIRYCDGILPAYMVLFSKSDTYRLYVKDNMVSSAGQNTISRKGMARLEVPIPCEAEQTEIVCILDSLFAKEQQVKEAAEAVLEKIDLLKKSILARAFRGELGTNNPTEDSALELLKQVLQEDAPTVTRKRSKSIPKELQAKLSTELERKIIKLYFKQETDSLPAEELLSVSSKKFEVMETLRALAQHKLIKKLPNGNYRLLE